ncbi:MAG: hypothetical protein P1U87_00825 [Verrucomicrobiales bacterium]|nr:hypothetical protein [Verrucomicrobiales bacterium]
MKSGRKSSVKKLLLALGALGGIFAYAATIGKDTPLGHHADHVFSKIKAPVTKPLAEFEKFTRRFGKASHDDPDHWALRDACMAAMFIERSGFHFSQSRWGGAPVPYQFRGLELVGPEKLPPNAGDIHQGIDLRIGYEILIASYRSFDNEKKEWESWRFDTPPNLTEMSFARQDGVWKIAIAPHKSYAVP